MVQDEAHDDTQEEEEEEEEEEEGRLKQLTTQIEAIKEEVQQMAKAADGAGRRAKEAAAQTKRILALLLERSQVAAGISDTHPCGD